jgi:hypothetical protein
MLNKVRCESVASKKYRVVLFGLGAIGIGTGKLVLNRENLSLIGAVDIDESKSGKDL